MKSFIVDSFTTEAFKGNPAGVCFPENDLSDEQMLKIAKEFGFSTWVEPRIKVGHLGDIELP